ncbi:MAG TPA: hypothetical protein PLD99_00520, partial [Parcubacteria group bacterium]|nr:hypothetical protein [Parcubacteria group bacterium]
MPGSQNIILWMVAQNLPLGHFEKYLEGGSLAKDASSAKSYTMKKKETIARAIVNGLSQYAVAGQVAKEWDSFDPQIRMLITDMCNNTASLSGNVRKGVARLDQLTGGKIRRNGTGPTERKLIVVDGTVVSVRQRVNTAMTNAER